MNENKIIKNPTDLAQLLNKVKQDKKYLINKYSLEDRVQILEDVVYYDDLIENLYEEFLMNLSCVITKEEANSLYENKDYDDLKTCLAICGDLNLKKKAFYDGEYSLEFMYFLTQNERKELISAFKDEIKPYIKNENDLRKLNELDLLSNMSKESYSNAEDFFYNVLCSIKSDETKFEFSKSLFKSSFLGLNEVQKKLISSLSDDSMKSVFIRESISFFENKNKENEDYNALLYNNSHFSDIVKSYNEKNKDDAIIEFNLIDYFFDEKWDIIKNKSVDEKANFVNKYRVNFDCDCIVSRELETIIESLKTDDEKVKFFSNVQKKWVDTYKIIEKFNSDASKIKAIKEDLVLVLYYSEVLKSIDFNSENINLMKQYNLFSMM